MTTVSALVLATTVLPVAGVGVVMHSPGVTEKTVMVMAGVEVGVVSVKFPNRGGRQFAAGVLDSPVFSYLL